MSIKNGVQSLREFQLTLALPAGARDNLELHLRDGIYVLRTWLLMKYHEPIQREKKVTFAFPETPWQHFKDAYFPLWAKKKWPVKMKVVEEIVRYVEGPQHICPHARGDKPDHDKFLNGELMEV